MRKCKIVRFSHSSFSYCVNIDEYIQFGPGRRQVKPRSAIDSSTANQIVGIATMRSCKYQGGIFHDLLWPYSCPVLHTQLQCLLQVFVVFIALIIRRCGTALAFVPMVYFQETLFLDVL